MKLLGIGTLALIAGASAAARVGRLNFTSSISRQPGWSVAVGLGAWLLGALVIALSANFVNLTDLRPGRALKTYSLLVLLGVCCDRVAPVVHLRRHRTLPECGTRSDDRGRSSGALVLAVLLLGPVVAVWRYDLGERAMLGDAGANAMGALAGYVLASSLPLWLLAIVAAILLALNLASEHVSFSRVIEERPLLRWIDGLGRLPADRPGEGDAGNLVDKGEGRATTDAGCDRYGTGKGRRELTHMTKYIFVTGGVTSSLGKGITAASLGRLLKSRGVKVTIQKLDPYLNVDPGTMSPFQHGEVFVTDDGGETDLDLGHYERFIDEALNRESNVTAGSVYQTLIAKERRGDFLGGTVQVIPHVTNEIKERILRLADKTQPDVVITEVGGTVGDIESLPFLEAIRQLKKDVGRDNVCYIHVTLVPYIAASSELKTKPTQHSVKELRSIGIQPDFIVCRSDRPIDAGHPPQDRPVLRRRSGRGRLGAGRPLDLRGARATSASRASTRWSSTTSRSSAASRTWTSGTRSSVTASS